MAGLFKGCLNPRAKSHLEKRLNRHERGRERRKRKRTLAVRLSEACMCGYSFDD